MQIVGITPTPIRVENPADVELDRDEYYDTPKEANML
jgi:hypothetical protein